MGFLLKLVDEGQLDRERFGRFLFHGIEASALMEKFPSSSKANNYPALLDYLFDLGRETADAWLPVMERILGKDRQSICKHYCRRIFDRACPIVADFSLIPGLGSSSP